MINKKNQLSFFRIILLLIKSSFFFSFFNVCMNNNKLQKTILIPEKKSPKKLNETASNLFEFIKPNLNAFQKCKNIINQDLNEKGQKSRFGCSFSLTPTDDDNKDQTNKTSLSKKYQQINQQVYSEIEEKASDYKFPLQQIMQIPTPSVPDQKKSLDQTIQFLKNRKKIINKSDFNDFNTKNLYKTLLIQPKIHIFNTFLNYKLSNIKNTYEQKLNKLEKKLNYLSKLSQINERTITEANNLISEIKRDLKTNLINTIEHLLLKLEKKLESKNSSSKETTKESDN